MTNILVAGATGMLGSRIAHHLMHDPAFGGHVRVNLLIRPSALRDPSKQQQITALVDAGATIQEGDLSDDSSLEKATQEVDVVISAVQGGAAVIVDGQIALARAAQDNGVRRFVASDFAIDLFNGPEGAPMFATRRQADELLDASELEVQHVLTGGFLDMMLNPRNPALVDAATSTITYWGDGTERFNMTTVDDTARLTARLAVDPTTGGGTFKFSAVETSMNDLADELEATTGRTVHRRNLGTLDELRTAIASETNPHAAMFLWYQLALATTPTFASLENHRYPDIELTGLRAQLTKAY